MFPGLPFRRMRGMRNIIAPDYREVDIDLVWDTATNDLPVLIAVLRTHFSRKPRRCSGGDGKSAFLGMPLREGFSLTIFESGSESG